MGKRNVHDIEKMLDRLALFLEAYIHGHESPMVRRRPFIGAVIETCGKRLLETSAYSHWVQTN